jgi:hypothetical protein
MAWFHPEEAAQVGVLLDYEHDFPGTLYLVDFIDGSSFVCTFDASYESENSGDLDIEMDDPRYDEFYQIAMQVIGTTRGGSIDGLTLDYRDFPARITDLGTGTVVYPASEVRAE